MVTNPSPLVAPGCLTSNCVGVVCGVCYQETFQMAIREAALSKTKKVMIRCCPRCARQVDIENAECAVEVAAGHPQRQVVSRRKRATPAELREIARSIHGKVFTRASDVMVAFGYSPRSPLMDTDLEFPLHLVQYREGSGTYRVNANGKEERPRRLPKW